VYVFARGADNQLWWQAYDGTRWSGWIAGGGVVSADPAAAPDGNGLSLFVRGGDNALYWQRLASGTWSGWRAAGGVLASRPVVAADVAGVTVIVRGGDNAVWWQRFASGVASGWTGLGGITIDDPGAVSDGNGLWIFVRGSDNALYWQRLVFAIPQGWQPGGGILTSAPAVVSDGPGVDVFARGGDGAPYWQRFAPGGGAGWQGLGGAVVGQPAATSDPSGITVFVRGADAQVYTQHYVSGWPGWTSIAGVPLGSGPSALSAPEIVAGPPPPPGGLGFDTCQAPSTSTMAGWRLASPYTSIGIYIGGENRACANTALNTPAWVNTVVAQGWRLIPIYVGLQAPCINFPSTQMSGDTATAYFQGALAANSAMNAATAAGLPGSSPIYFDMEAYNNSTLACAAPVWSFVSGWVAQLHAGGYVAGMYSSLCSGVVDQAALYNNAAYNRLDAIWIAAWNGTPNLLGFTGTCALSDTYWPYHQRIHQYAGGHNETYAGVTLGVDNDVVDGPLAPP
jgi:hypothetical protein